jgi:hypothetical protein
MPVNSGFAISGHGTLLARAPQASPTVFTTIAELNGDIAVPDLTRKEIDVSTQNRDIDTYVTGMLRRSSITFAINYIAIDPTHDNLTGLYAAMRQNTIDGYKVTFPDGDVWVCSGQISAIKKKAPVDGALTADVTIRPSGGFTINGMVIGAAS